MFGAARVLCVCCGGHKHSIIDWLANLTQLLMDLCVCVHVYVCVLSGMLSRSHRKRWKGQIWGSKCGTQTHMEPITSLTEFLSPAQCTLSAHLSLPLCQFTSLYDNWGDCDVWM